MRNTLIIVTLFVGLFSMIGCVSDVKKEVAKTEKPAAKGAATKGAANKPGAKKAWREKAKAAQARKRKAGAARPAANRPQKKTVDTKLKAKYNQPIRTEQNKGVFISEISQYLKLTPAKTSRLEEVIKKYKRKGLDFKFFGGFYSNTKPFAKDLSKVFTPLEMEKFKHFHAFWFDRIPYPRPDMPVSLYYRLNLDKAQFIKVLDIYSSTTLAKAKGQKAMIAKGTANIEALLNAKQKKIYKEILSVSTELF